MIKLQHNPPALRQSLDRFNKFQILVFLKKLEDISACMAPEAVIDLPLRIDVEARAFLLVKRAQGHVITAGAFEREVASNHLDDITCRPDLLNSGLGDAPGHGANAGCG